MGANATDRAFTLHCTIYVDTGTYHAWLSDLDAPPGELPLWESSSPAHYLAHDASEALRSVLCDVTGAQLVLFP